MISPRLINGVRVVNVPDPENVWRLNRGCLPMSIEMETVGMRINPQHLLDLNVRLTHEMEALAAKVVDLTGIDCNLASGDQLANLLFKELRLKQNGREKWTKSKARLAADADVLKAMVSQHSAIKPILDWKERQKLKSTYTTSLIAKCDEHQRIHSDLSTTTTETNRFACVAKYTPIKTKRGIIPICEVIVGDWV